MKALLQRVEQAQVSVDGNVTGKISAGLCIFICAAEGDTDKDLNYIADKIVNLRIFEDEEGKMNRSLLDVGGQALIVSQFTLCADCRKGRRPSWNGAAKPETARSMYNRFIEKVREYGVHAECGIFQAEMKVAIVNDGPVTIMLDTKE